MHSMTAKRFAYGETWVIRSPAAPTMRWKFARVRSLAEPTSIIMSNVVWRVCRGVAHEHIDDQQPAVGGHGLGQPL